MHLRNVLDVYSCAIHGLDGQIIQIVETHRTAVHPNLILGFRDLGGAGRQKPDSASSAHSKYHWAKAVLRKARPDSNPPSRCNADNGNVYIRKDVDRHGGDGGAAQDGDQHRHYDKGIRATEGQSDDSHNLLLRHTSTP
jgi:hypothetical protein